MKKLIVAVIATAGIAFTGAASAQADLAQKNCGSCHALDTKKMGPSFKDIAAKYKGQTDLVAKLSAKVRKGGSGVFGPVPMAPNPPEKISDADLKAAIELILKS